MLKLDGDPAAELAGTLERVRGGERLHFRSDVELLELIRRSRPGPAAPRRRAVSADPETSSSTAVGSRPDPVDPTARGH